MAGDCRDGAGPTPPSPSRSSSAPARSTGCPELVRSIGAREALLVTTPGRAASPEGERVVGALGRTLASTFAEVGAARAGAARAAGAAPGPP